GLGRRAGAFFPFLPLQSRETRPARTALTKPSARALMDPSHWRSGMERSFTREVALLRKGDGEIFEGEGILAITKALLQAGVSYVSGYQGAPVSHLMDVLSDAKDVLDELGVHFEPAANEAGAAAMLAASINYP